MELLSVEELCPVPLAYFCGDKDFVVLARNLELIQAIRPDVRVTHFNTSHAILQSEPEKAWQAIIKFVENLN